MILVFKMTKRYHSNHEKRKEKRSPHCVAVRRQKSNKVVLLARIGGRGGRGNLPLHTLAPARESQRQIDCQLRKIAQISIKHRFNRTQKCWFIWKLAQHARYITINKLQQGFVKYKTFCVWKLYMYTIIIFHHPNHFLFQNSKSINRGKKCPLCGLILVGPREIPKFLFFFGRQGTLWWHKA